MANVTFLMRTLFFSDVIWGVDPAVLVSNTLSSGHSVFLPKSRCSEPCELGAVKVRHEGTQCQIMTDILLQKMSEGEKCCWVCTWCQVILSTSRIEEKDLKTPLTLTLTLSLVTAALFSLLLSSLSLCQDHEFVVDEFSCRDCGVGRWPHTNKSSCFDIEVREVPASFYITFEIKGSS